MEQLGAGGATRHQGHSSDVHLLHTHGKDVACTDGGAANSKLAVNRVYMYPLRSHCGKPTGTGNPRLCGKLCTT